MILLAPTEASVPLATHMATALTPQHQNGMAHQRPRKKIRIEKLQIWGKGMIPLAPLSPWLPSGHGPETSTPEWNDTPETKGEKIGELASTRRACRLLTSLRERQRSRRFRGLRVFYKELGTIAGTGKGQLISKCPFGVIISTKIPTIFF